MKKPKTPPEFKILRKAFRDKKRHLLLEYMEDKKINKFITKMNSKYLHWDEFVHRIPPNNASKELIWLLMKFNRNSTSMELNINDEKEFLFKFNILDTMQQKLHKLI